jgi:hypothetical protein
VTRVDALANFETQESLRHTFVEGGLTFTRVNLSEDNNGCGSTGSNGSPNFVGFPGNYLYGVAFDGYIEIVAEAGHTFRGLEFISGTGFLDDAEAVTQHWEAYLAGLLVGSESLAFSPWAIVGFSDQGVLGFDAVRFASTSDGTGTLGAPAIDSVRADLRQGF